MSSPGGYFDGAGQPASGDARSRSRWSRALIALLAILIVYVIACYILVLVNIPAYYHRLVSQTVTPVLLNGEVVVDNSLLAMEATARAMTLRGYAIYSLLLNLLVAGGFILAGLLILSRAQRDWFRWFTGFILLFFPSGRWSACWKLQVPTVGSSFWVLCFGQHF